MLPILCVVLIPSTVHGAVGRILYKTSTYVSTMPPPAQPAREGDEDNGDIPPAFHEDLTLREMKASFKSNKGALTRLSNQVKKSEGGDVHFNQIPGTSDPTKRVVQQIPGEMRLPTLRRPPVGPGG